MSYPRKPYTHLRNKVASGGSYVVDSFCHQDGTSVCDRHGLPVIGERYPRRHPSSAREWFLYGFGCPLCALTGVYTLWPFSMPELTMRIALDETALSYVHASSSSESVSESTQSGTTGVVGDKDLSLASSCALYAAAALSAAALSPSGSFEGVSLTASLGDVVTANAAASVFVVAVAPGGNVWTPNCEPDMWLLCVAAVAGLESDPGW